MNKQNKVSFSYDRLGRCFRFVYIYVCIVLFFLCCYCFSVNKDLYKIFRKKSPEPSWSLQIVGYIQTSLIDWRHSLQSVNLVREDKINLWTIIWYVHGTGRQGRGTDVCLRRSVSVEILSTALHIVREIEFEKVVHVEMIAKVTIGLSATRYFVMFGVLRCFE